MLLVFGAISIWWYWYLVLLVFDSIGIWCHWHLVLLVYGAIGIWPGLNSPSLNSAVVSIRPDRFARISIRCLNSPGLRSPLVVCAVRGVWGVPYVVSEVCAACAVC